MIEQNADYDQNKNRHCFVGMNFQLERQFLFHLITQLNAKWLNKEKYWKRASFPSDNLSIKGHCASNRQKGEFTNHYIYTLSEKEEQVTQKHILMIEKFHAVWIKEHTRNQVFAVEVLIGMVKWLTKFDKT